MLDGISDSANTFSNTPYIRNQGRFRLSIWPLLDFFGFHCGFHTKLIKLIALKSLKKAFINLLTSDFQPSRAVPYLILASSLDSCAAGISHEVCCPLFRQRLHSSLHNKIVFCFGRAIYLEIYYCVR